MYIHIPFCNKICSYCDFPKVYYNEHQVNKYLDILNEEIKNDYQNDIIKTLYIGGGTPSSLSIIQLTKLFEILNQVKKAENLEYTIECNIDSLSIEKLNLFKKYNINRLSIGIQSINKDKLKIMERTVNKNHLEKMIKYAKNIDISNINCDLMYGMQNETINILKNDIDYILSLDITHVSIYSLIIEENTKLMINKTKSIDEDLEYQMYTFICNKLKENNFIHYEISNFSKENYQSRHNLSYWNNKQYYGFGLGAAGYIKNNRYCNTKSITKYLSNNNVKENEKLSIDDIIEYEIITNLRKLKGISKNEFLNKYNFSINSIFNYKKLIEDGYIIESNNNIYIKEKYLYLSNEIINMFLESRKKNEK